jgi:signal transduction histidine kinase
MYTTITLDRNFLLRHIFNLFIKPTTRKPENEWREMMFNLVLVGSALIVAITGLLFLYGHQTTNLNIAISLEVFIIVMLALSRSGHYKIAIFSIFSGQLIITSYFAYTRSVTPEILLSYSILITIVGVLIGRHTTVGLTAFIALYMSIIKGIDGMQYSIMLLTVALICYLSRRELEKRLARAKKSEAMLKLEQSELEVKINEGKKKLKDAELQKMSHLYRFAEFGKLSSGLFHDLVNPLTAMSLYLDDLAGSKSLHMPIELKKKVETALFASKRMEGFIMAIRKQLAQETDKKTFSVRDEISQAIEILVHRANKENIQIACKNKNDIYMYGNPLRFYQVVLNLISNAIDAYKEASTSRKRKVEITIRDYYQSVNVHLMEISVRDYGVGMDAETMKKVFEPFFTTKSHFVGTGIGLSTTKGIIEKDFGGEIVVVSSKDKGTTFTVTIPLVEYS